MNCNGADLQAKEMLERQAPGFLEDRPAAMFELQAARCQALIADSRHAEALTLIHTILTPLCTANPALKPRLKVCCFPGRWASDLSIHCTTGEVFMFLYRLDNLTCSIASATTELMQECQ